jgi:hypothetical protein
MLNSAPARWTIGQLRKHIAGGAQTETTAGYEPARVYGFYGLRSRLRLAWDVFTGEADALYWPGQRPPRAY